MASRSTRTSPPSRRRRGSSRRRRALDGLIVAAVAALAAVAVTDVLRADGDGDRGGDDLRAAGIRGVLVYTDRDCVLHAVRLPGLEQAPLPAGPDVGCEFELSPDGTHVEPPGAAWNPERPGYALCRGNVVDVVTLPPRASRPDAQFEGCSPAWRPGVPARLTVVDEGAIEEASGDDVVISAEALLEASRRHPNTSDLSLPSSIDVEDVVWLSPEEAVVLLRLRLPYGPQDLVARFQNGHVRETYAFRDDDATSLEVSAGGHFVLVEPARLALHVGGSTLDVSAAVGRARAGAWSADERWLVLARPGQIAFLETRGFGGPPGRILDVPIDARDVAWAPDERPPAITFAATGEAAQLHAAGLTGTIVYTDYTDLGCQLRALRLPGLEPVEPPSGPAVGCLFEVSPDGERVAPRNSAWTGGHAAYALCSGESVQVYRPPSGRPQAIFEGCTPAWRPGPPFRLTLVRNGAVVDCGDTPPCGEALISHEALRDAAARHTNAPVDRRAVRAIDVEDVVWLSPSRAVLLLRLTIKRVGRHDLIAIFEGGRVRGTYAFVGDDLERLEASPDRTSIASEPEVFAFRSDGPRIGIPDAFGPIAAVAWSSDGRRLALAAERAIVIVAPGERQLRIPVTAADVAWR